MHLSRWLISRLVFLGVDDVTFNRFWCESCKSVRAKDPSLSKIRRLFGEVNGVYVYYFIENSNVLSTGTVVPSLIVQH